MKIINLKHINHEVDLSMITTHTCMHACNICRKIEIYERNKMKFQYLATSLLHKHSCKIKV